MATALGYSSQRLGRSQLATTKAHDLLDLDVKDHYTASALYFDDEDDAIAVAKAFEPHTHGFGFVGYVVATTMTIKCLITQSIPPTVTATLSR